MNTYWVSNPETAYSGADCLLFNGYGLLAIPLFAEFSVNGNNEKYLNGRMGYGWSHAADWYEVGGEVFQEMMGDKEFTTWITEEIQKEILNNYEKYGHDAVSQKLTEKLTLHTYQNPLTAEQTTTFEKCTNLVANMDNYSCVVNLKAPSTQNYLQDCRETDTSDRESFECLDTE